MIFRRALVSDVANSAGSVFTILFSIVVTIGLVQILGQAAGGKIDSQTVAMMVAYSSLTNLPPLLALSLFIAVMMALSRSWMESEMVVWFSSGGLSLLAWIRPVMRFAVPVVCLVAVLSLSISPWARGQIQSERERFSQRDDVNKIAPGRFIESMNGKRVIFIDAIDPSGTNVTGVFLSDQTDGKDSIILAQSGTVKVNADGERFITLINGRRYEGKRNTPEYKVSDFKSYGVRIDSKPEVPLEARHISSKPIQTLLRDMRTSVLDRGEFVWRVSWPAASLLLALLAIPLSFANPRAGRSLNLVVAVLLFIVYMNGINVVRTWVQQGAIAMGAGLLLLHGPAVLLTVCLFVRRVWLQRWLPRCMTWGYWSDRIHGGPQ